MSRATFTWSAASGDPKHMARVVTSTEDRSFVAALDTEGVWRIFRWDSTGRWDDLRVVRGPERWECMLRVERKPNRTDDQYEASAFSMLDACVRVEREALSLVRRALPTDPLGSLTFLWRELERFGVSNAAITFQVHAAKRAIVRVKLDIARKRGIETPIGVSS